MTSDGLQPLLDDLRAEHEALDALVAPLDEAGWDIPTPAEGWAVRDQISHLAFFDGTARAAVIDPDAFTAELERVVADPDGFAEQPLRKGRSMTGTDVLDWWRVRRRELLDAFATLDPSARVPWYGPPMGARSFVTARLMETWAHGQDVVDALGTTRPGTVRLRHVAHIGVGARPFSYAVRGMRLPEQPVRVELSGPDGEEWTWGEEGSADRVTGPALDFCLVVTQRRHPDDVELHVEGDAAREWISIAQAFAGGATSGRKPGQFPRR